MEYYSPICISKTYVHMCIRICCLCVHSILISLVCVYMYVYIDTCILVLVNTVLLWYVQKHTSPSLFLVCGYLFACMYVFAFLSICIVSFMYFPIIMVMLSASITHVQKYVEISLLGVNWIRRCADVCEFVFIRLYIYMYTHMNGYVYSYQCTDKKNYICLCIYAYARNQAQADMHMQMCIHAITLTYIPHIQLHMHSHACICT